MAAEIQGGDGPIEALIWDMNGVLIDDEPYQWAAFRRVLEEQDVRVPDEDFARYCGVTESECFAAALGLPESHPSIATCMAQRRSRYREIMQGRVPMYPAAREAIERAAAAGYAQAIASGACREEVMAVVAALGPHRFRAVIAAEDVSRGKPDPEGFLRAADRLGAGPARCCVVEDSIYGIEAALSAGMRCIAVASSLPIERLVLAHVAFPSLQEVLRSGILQL